MSLLDYLKKLKKQVKALYEAATEPTEARYARERAPKSNSSESSRPAAEPTKRPRSTSDVPVCIHCHTPMTFVGIAPVTSRAGVSGRVSYAKCTQCGTLCSMLLRPMARRNALGEAAIDHQPVVDVFWTKPVNEAKQDQDRLDILQRRLSNGKGTGPKDITNISN